MDKVNLEMDKSFGLTLDDITVLNAENTRLIKEYKVNPKKSIKERYYKNKELIKTYFFNGGS